MAAMGGRAGHCVAAVLCKQERYAVTGIRCPLYTGKMAPPKNDKIKSALTVVCVLAALCALAGRTAIRFFHF